ncbi:MAG: sulfotransferase [Acidobacteria bacterium]|nr:MAG: sulfotransferase [Acidobacteriota bacterium]MCL4286513.1 sulfotransferase [Thermoleophilia bacterium]GIK76577.1 MAG: sulfotransferase [Actinomycetes bacterium]
MSDRRPERFLYIAGTSFTGSTLLSFLLNLHPQIVAVGEMTGPFRGVTDRREYPCSCGAKLSECPFWAAVGVEMAGRGLRFDPEHWDLRFDPENALSRRALTSSLRSNRADALRDSVAEHAPVLGKRIRAISRRNEAVVASARAITGKPVFVDASKNINRARQLDRTTSLSPHVVHLVRDALGFVASKKSRAGKSARAARAGRVGDASRYWSRRSAQAERLFAALPPERRLRVRYEDLCADPEREFGRVCALLGLEPLPGPYEFLAGEHHIIGNRMRLSSSSEIVLDERWREILTAEEAEAVRRSTERHRRAFGYA